MRCLPTKNERVLGLVILEVFIPQSVDLTDLGLWPLNTSWQEWVAEEAVHFMDRNQKDKGKGGIGAPILL